MALLQRPWQSQQVDPFARRPQQVDPFARLDSIHAAWLKEEEEQFAQLDSVHAEYTRSVVPEPDIGLLFPDAVDTPTDSTYVVEPQAPVQVAPREIGDDQLVAPPPSFDSGQFIAQPSSTMVAPGYMERVSERGYQGPEPLPPIHKGLSRSDFIESQMAQNVRDPAYMARVEEISGPQTAERMVEQWEGGTELDLRGVMKSGMAAPVTGTIERTLYGLGAKVVSAAARVAEHTGDVLDTIDEGIPEEFRPQGEPILSLDSFVEKLRSAAGDINELVGEAKEVRNQRTAQMLEIPEEWANWITTAGDMMAGGAVTSGIILGTGGLATPAMMALGLGEIDQEAEAKGLTKDERSFVLELGLSFGYARIERISEKGSALFKNPTFQKLAGRFQRLLPEGLEADMLAGGTARGIMMRFGLWEMVEEVAQQSVVMGYTGGMGEGQQYTSEEIVQALAMSAVGGFVGSMPLGAMAAFRARGTASPQAAGPLDAQYATLGLDPNASMAEVDKAFRDLASPVHPDRNPGNAEAEAQFKVYSNARADIKRAFQEATQEEEPVGYPAPVIIPEPARIPVPEPPIGAQDPIIYPDQPTIGPELRLDDSGRPIAPETTVQPRTPTIPEPTGLPAPTVSRTEEQAVPDVFEIPKDHPFAGIATPTSGDNSGFVSETSDDGKGNLTFRLKLKIQNRNWLDKNGDRKTRKDFGSDADYQVFLELTKEFDVAREKAKRVLAKVWKGLNVEPTLSLDERIEAATIIDPQDRMPRPWGDEPALQATGRKEALDRARHRGRVEAQEKEQQEAARKKAGDLFPEDLPIPEKVPIPGPEESREEYRQRVIESLEKDDRQHIALAESNAERLRAMPEEHQEFLLDRWEAGSEESYERLSHLITEQEERVAAGKPAKEVFPPELLARLQVLVDSDHKAARYAAGFQRLVMGPTNTYTAESLEEQVTMLEGRVSGEIPMPTLPEPEPEPADLFTKPRAEPETPRVAEPEVAPPAELAPGARVRVTTPSGVGGGFTGTVKGLNPDGTVSVTRGPLTPGAEPSTTVHRLNNVELVDEPAAAPPPTTGAPTTGRPEVRTQAGWQIPTLGGEPVAEPTDKPKVTSRFDEPTISRTGEAAFYLNPLAEGDAVGAADVEPERFQYKDFKNTKGETHVLKDVTKWVPERSGIIAVWRDPVDGRYKVINGHQRWALAQRLGINEIRAIEIPAATAEEARAAGALMNIGEGTGTAIDAAKVMRDTNRTPEDLKEQGVSLRGQLVKDATALANLPDGLFALVAREKIPIKRAVALGKADLTHSQQWAVWEQVKQEEAEGRKRVTNDELEEMARFVKAAPLVQMTEVDEGGQPVLFGEEEGLPDLSLSVEKARLSAWVKKELARTASTFSFASKPARAKMLEAAEVGELDPELAGEIAQKATVVKEVYGKLSGFSGPVADALNRAALRLHEGGVLNDVQQELLTDIKAAVGKELGTDKGEQQAEPSGPEVIGAVEEVRGEETGLGTEQQQTMKWVGESGNVVRAPEGDRVLNSLVERGLLTKTPASDSEITDEDVSAFGKASAWRPSTGTWAEFKAVPVDEGPGLFGEVREERAQYKPQRTTLDRETDKTRTPLESFEHQGIRSHVFTREDGTFGVRLEAGEGVSGFAAIENFSDLNEARVYAKLVIDPKAIEDYLRRIEEVAIDMGVKFDAEGNPTIFMDVDPSTPGKLATGLYQAVPSITAIKELLQNHIDATRGVKGGFVTVVVNTKEGTITVTDNGKGMTPAVLTGPFVNIGGSGKQGDTDTGAYGFAKAAYFTPAEKIEVTTVAEDDTGTALSLFGSSKRLRSGFTATGKEWAETGIKGATLGEKTTDPTGTTVKLTYTPEYDEDKRASGAFGIGDEKWEEQQRKASWISAEQWARNFLATQRTGVDVSVTIDGEMVEPYSWVDTETTEEPIQVIYVDGASLVIRTGTKTVKERPQVYVLNRGQYQFKAGWNEGLTSLPAAEYPAVTTIDISSTVKVEDKNYPFVASREGTKGETLKAVVKFIDQIKLAGALKRAQQMKDALDEVELIGGTEVPVYRTYEGINRAAEKSLASRPVVQNVGVAIRDAFDFVLADMIETGRLPEGHALSRIKFGLGFAHDWRGLNISGTEVESLAMGEEEVAVEDATIPNVILVNPFTIFHDAVVASEAEDYTYKPLTARELAISSWKTTTHELGHQNQRNHENGWRHELRNIDSYYVWDGQQGEILVGLETAWEAFLSSKEGQDAFEEIKEQWNDPGQALWQGVSLDEDVARDIAQAEPGPLGGEVRGAPTDRTIQDSAGALLGTGDSPRAGVGGDPDAGGVREGTGAGGVTPTDAGRRAPSLRRTDDDGPKPPALRGTRDVVEEPTVEPRGVHTVDDPAAPTGKKQHKDIGIRVTSAVQPDMPGTVVGVDTEGGPPIYEVEFDNGTTDLLSEDELEYDESVRPTHLPSLGVGRPPPTRGTAREDLFRFERDLFGDPYVDPDSRRVAPPTSDPTQGDLLPESEGPQGMDLARSNALSVTSLLKGKYEAGALSPNERQRYEDQLKLLRVAEGKGIDPTTIQNDAETLPADEYTVDMFPDMTPKEVREQMALKFGSVEAGAKVVTSIIEADEKHGIGTFAASMDGVMRFVTRAEAVAAGTKNAAAWVEMIGQNVVKEDGTTIDTEKVAAIILAGRDPSAEHIQNLATDSDGEVIHHVLSKSGSLASADISVVDVVGANSIAKQAGGVAFLAHNHPSGRVKPSGHDIEATRNAIETAERQGSVFGGHYIVNHLKAVVITAENIDDIALMHAQKAPEKEFLDKFGVRLKGKRSALEWTNPDAKKVGTQQHMFEYLKGLPEDESRVDIMFMNSSLDVESYQPHHVGELETIAEWVPGLMRQVASSRLILGVRGQAAFNAAVAAAQTAPVDIVDVVDVTDPTNSAHVQRLLPERTDEEIVALIKGLAEVREDRPGLEAAPAGKLPPTTNIKTLLSGEEALSSLDIPGKNLARAVGMTFKQRAIAINGRILDIADEVDQELISQIMADEVNQVLDAPGGEEGNAAQWYSEKLEAAFQIVGRARPAIVADPIHLEAFRFALAITSNEQKVRNNAKLALQVYDAWAETSDNSVAGRFDTSLGWGMPGGQMRLAWEQWNKMADAIGEEKLSRLLDTTATVAELKAGGLTITSELQTEIVPVSTIFGSKVGGAFFRNLGGIFDAVTMDRWFRRTIGRITGDMMVEPTAKTQRENVTRLLASLQPEDYRPLGYTKDMLGKITIEESIAARLKVARAAKGRWEKTRKAKVKEGQSKPDKPEWALAAERYIANLDPGIREAPVSPAERSQLRVIVKRVQELVGGDHDLASIQAILWYPEKRLYTMLGVYGKPAQKRLLEGEDIASEDEVDYETAFREIFDDRTEGADTGLTPSGVERGAVGEARRLAGAESTEFRSGLEADELIDTLAELRTRGALDVKGAGAAPSGLHEGQERGRGVDVAGRADRARANFGETRGREVREEREEYRLGAEDHELPGEGSRRNETDTPEGWYDHTELPSLRREAATEAWRAVFVPLKAARTVYRYYAETLTDKVKRQGGEVGKELAQRAERVTDKTKALLGVWDEARSKIQKLVSGGPKQAVKTRKLAQSAINWLQSPMPAREGQHPAAVYRRIQRAVEGEISLEQMPKRVGQVVEAIRGLNSVTGAHFQSIGLRQVKTEVRENPQFLAMLDDVLTGKAPEDTVFRLFTPAGEGKVFLRMMTPQLQKIWMNPSTDLKRNPEWDQLVEILAAENGLDAPKVGRILNSSRENASKRMHAEIPRVFKNFPTDMKLVGKDGGVDTGKSVPLLWTHPSGYATSVTASSAHRSAFVEEFGQGLDDKRLSQAIDRALQAGIDPADTNRLFRALNGMSEASPLSAPDAPAHEITNGFGHLMAIPRALMLTRSIVPNTFEVLGNIQAFGGGAGRLVKMTKKLAASEEGWRATQKLYARMGLAQTWVMNATVDRQRPLHESVPRIFREYALRAFPTIHAWKFQEMQAAAMGVVLAEDLRASEKDGGSSGIQLESDLFVLEHMLGFTEDEVAEFRTKTASNEMYVEIARRFASRSNTTLLSLPAEESQAASSATFNMWIAFHRYSMMKVRSIDKLHTGLWAEVTRFKDSDRGSKDKTRLAGAMKTVAQYHAGTAISGALTFSLLALLAGGTKGLLAALGDFWDEPTEFMLDGWVTSQLGPIFNTVSRMWADPQVENIWMISAPVSIIRETVAWTTNSGRYQFMSASESSAAYLGRMSPGPRAIKDLVVAAGLTATDAERDLAIDRYWKWTRDNNPAQTVTEWRRAEADTRTFRTKMRKAYVLMARENQTGESIRKADEFVNAAIAVEGKEISNAAASVRSRRLLTRVPDEQMDDLREFLKPDLFAALERHDDILTNWASSFQNRPRQRVRTQRPRTQRTRQRSRQ